MIPRRWKSLIGTALLSLTLAHSPEARPLPPVLPEHLSDQEMFCHVLGEWAYVHALSRDAGLSYLHMLTRTRKGQKNDSVLNRTLQEAIEINLRLVYMRTHLTPEQTRNTTELACVQMFEQARAKQEKAHAQSR